MEKRTSAKASERELIVPGNSNVEGKGQGHVFLEYFGSSWIIPKESKTKHNDNNKDFNMKSFYKAVRTNSVLPVPKFALRFNLSSSPSWPPATRPASFHRPAEAILGRHREDNLPRTFLMHHKVCCFPSLEMWTETPRAALTRASSYGSTEASSSYGEASWIPMRNSLDLVHLRHMSLQTGGHKSLKILWLLEISLAIFSPHVSQW